MGAGKEAKTCTIGCASRIRDCDVPIQIPTGTVQIDPTTRHASTRMNVSPVPKRSSTHVTRGTWRSVWTSWTAPYMTKTNNPVRIVLAVQIRNGRLILDFMKRRGSIIWPGLWDRSSCFFSNDRWSTRRCHVSSNSRKPVLLIAQREGFADAEEKPSSRHRHKAVPHQIHCRKGQLHLQQGLAGIEPNDAGDLFEIRRHGLQRRIKTEGHVPDLAGENHDDAGQLKTRIGFGKQRNQHQYQPGKKTQHRYTLENIQQWNQQALRSRRDRKSTRLNSSHDQIS